MNNRVKALLTVIMVIIVLITGCKSPAVNPLATSNQSTNISEGINIGDRAIDFELQTLDGKTVKLSDFRGKNPVLLNFWATWCGPCRFEMPFLQQINDAYSAKGLVVLAVDINESPATIQKFMTELNLRLTVPIDTGTKVAKSYGITGIPSTFLIDKNGVIQQKVIGAFPNEAAIEDALKTIMP